MPKQTLSKDVYLEKILSVAQQIMMLQTNLTVLIYIYDIKYIIHKR
jgi:hypothetical protein